jgi:hypothetical protein
VHRTVIRRPSSVVRRPSGHKIKSRFTLNFFSFFWVSIFFFKRRDFRSSPEEKNKIVQIEGKFITRFGSLQGPTQGYDASSSSVG